MAEEPLQITVDESGRAIIALNRPEMHNAFDDTLITALTDELKKLEKDDSARIVLLTGKGKSFSAGADLNWMKRIAGYSKEENLRDAMALAELMKTLYGLAKPTIALVHGATYGGGVGLVACCDIAVATKKASFCLSEVRLGLIPAVISPYVAAAIGPRACRRYFLTAELFDADEACRIGLVHEVVAGDEELKAKGESLSDEILKNSPAGVRAAKDLISVVSGRCIDDKLIAETAERISNIRASEEGREGLSAFLEKRKPSWLKG